MFFQKIIEACDKEIFSLKNSLLEGLKTSGIDANLTDLEFSKEGIFLYFPDDSKIKVQFYQDKIQENVFRTQGDPLVHIFSCKEALNLFETQKSSCRIILNKENKFFLGIYSHKVQTRFFYDKPLKLCPSCQKMLNCDLKEFLNL